MRAILGERPRPSGDADVERREVHSEVSAEVCEYGVEHFGVGEMEYRHAIPADGNAQNFAP